MSTYWPNYLSVGESKFARKAESTESWYSMSSTENSKIAHNEVWKEDILSGIQKAVDDN